jgi:hypothetical protein
LATPPPPQVCGAVHEPQLRVPPQPSPTVPQLAFICAHVLGVHGGVPHWLSTPPPPQNCGAVHEPQLRVPPQPSPTVPQFALS